MCLRQREHHAGQPLGKRSRLPHVGAAIYHAGNAAEQVDCFAAGRFAAGGYLCAVSQVVGILIAKAGQVAIVPQKLLLHLADILRRQIAQLTSMLQSDGCCRAHGLAAHRAGGNDARRGHGQLACAQCAAPGQ